jgi:hypothetical protein
MPDFVPCPVIIHQFFDNDGVPLAFGKVYTYGAGTLTPQAAYEDVLGTPHANPIILDADGRATIFISGLSYKFIVKTADNTTLYTVDGISEGSLTLVEGDVMGTTDEQDVSNKAFDNSNSFEVKDTSLNIQSQGDATKKFHFLASGITAGQNRAVTIPDSDFTVVGVALTQTLTNKTLTSPTINTPTINTPTIATPAITAGTSVNMVQSDRTKVNAYAADGAITIETSQAMLTKAGVNAMTLASPTNPDHNGVEITIQAATANAHTVTLVAGFNGAGAGADVATFGGAIGDAITIVAYNGVWYVKNLVNVTLA